MANNEWELSKENVLPIKRGRSTKGLQESLARPIAAQGGQENADQDREQMFEKELKDASNDSSQLLEWYIKYIKWVRDRFPTNSDKAMKLLERCTCELKDEESLKNDMKFIKLWIEYADMVKTPGEIFSFMQSNKIGERIALFWIAWAFVAEKFDNFKLADQIFQKGIRKQAEPKDVLQKRYQQFQRRMARYFLNRVEEGADEIADTAPKPNVLQTIGTNGQQQTKGLSSQSTNGVKSSSQTKKTSSSNPTNAQFSVFSDEPQSSALPGELAENKAWKHLGKDAERRKENEGPITKWNEGPLQYSSNRLQPAAPSLPVRAIPVAPQIQIFVDPELDNDNAADDIDEESDEPKRMKAKVETNEGNIRRKLDSVAGKEGLKIHSSMSELERINTNPLGKHKGDSESTAATEDKPKKQETKRDQPVAIDKPNAVDKIRGVADERVKEVAPKAVPRQQRPTATSIATAAPPLPAKSNSGFEIYSEESIRPTKQASSVPDKGVAFQVFEEEFHQSAHSKPVIVTAPATTGFSILTSGKAVEPTQAVSTIMAATKKGGMAETGRQIGGFSVFADEELQSSISQPKTKSVPPSLKSAAKPAFEIFSDDSTKPAAQKTVTKPAFEIFSDDAAKPAMQKATTKAAFEIFSDESANFTGMVAIKPPKHASSTVTLHTPCKEELPQPTVDISIHEDDLDAILADMGVLDEEDGTINTRLARKDIDSMFCSPQAKIEPVILRQKVTDAKVAKIADNSPKVLPLKSFTSSFAAQSSAPFAHRSFGGSDLSAIPEASCEYSMCGPLNVSPIPTQPVRSRLSTICSTSSNPSNCGQSDGFSIFCDFDSPAPAAPAAPAAATTHQGTGMGIGYNNHKNGIERVGNSNVEILQGNSKSLVSRNRYDESDSWDSEREFALPKRRKMFKLSQSSVETSDSNEIPASITSSSNSIYGEIEVVVGCDGVFTDPQSHDFVAALEEKKGEMHIESIRQRKRTNLACKFEAKSTFLESDTINLVHPVSLWDSKSTDRFVSSNNLDCIQVSSAFYEQQKQLKYLDVLRAIKSLASSIDSPAWSCRKHVNVNSIIEIDGLMPIEHKTIKKQLKSKLNILLTNKSENDKDAVTYCVDSLVGEGSFGFALLLVSKGSSPKPTSMQTQQKRNKVVAKFDCNKCYVAWEYYVHQVIQHQLKFGSRNARQTDNWKIYQHSMLPPEQLLVYDNGAVMTMAYADIGTLGNFVNMIITKQLLLTSEEHEAIVAFSTVQMLEAVQCLHFCDVLHGDIKSDNWVFASGVDSNSGESLYQLLRLKLIDFGKSKMLLVNQSNVLLDSVTEGDRLVFGGGACAVGHACNAMQSGRSWTYQADCFGICACLHQLLFLEDLSTVTETTKALMRRGIVFPDDDLMMVLRQQKIVNMHVGRCAADVLDRSETDQWIGPKNTLRRYWKRPLWSVMYLLLLNYDDLQMPLPYDKMLFLLREFLSTVKAPLHHALQKLFQYVKRNR